MKSVIIASALAGVMANNATWPNKNHIHIEGINFNYFLLEIAILNGLNALETLFSSIFYLFHQITGDLITKTFGGSGIPELSRMEAFDLELKVIFVIIVQN